MELAPFEKLKRQKDVELNYSPFSLAISCMLECTQNSKSCHIKLLIGPKLYLDEIINPSKL